jgi:P-type conjugative transfer protein TrbJ
MSHRRRTVLVAVLSAFLFASAPPKMARADLFGGDLAELAAILAELLSQGLAIASQLEQLQTQVRYTEQTLRQLDPTSFRGLLNTFNTLRWNYQSLAGQVQTISFTANHVQSDFNRLFPKDKDAWRGARSSDFDRYYTGWQTEISNSSLVAMSAQTQIDLLRRQNDVMTDILRQSQGANGELRQLQLINQSLAKIHDRLGTVVEVLATSQRVTAALAASTSGQNLMIRESKQRRLDGYTDRGRPSRVLNRLP